MSDLFAMTDESADPKLAQAQANSVDSLSEIDSPLFRGSLKGLGLGVMRGFAKVADTVGLALAPFANAPAPSYLTGSGSFQRVAESPELTDPIYKAIDDTTGKAVDYWTPRANEVGRVGQVLGGLGEAGSELVAGLGSPHVLVATNTAEGGKQLVDQGVDAKTAGAAAALEGAASYAGLKIPIAGSTLLSRIATGAAGNVLLGSGTRAAEKKLLESQGYTDQAQPFTTDATAVSMDALLGALFGATHHALSPRIDPRLTPSQSDAILTARNAKNFQQETAPGTPADVRASAAHQDAMETALEQLSRGEPVDVGDQVAQHQGAQFEPAGKVEETANLAKLVEENAPKDPLIEEQNSNQAIEARLRNRIESDPQGAMAEYSALPESDGGKILNTDIARELSPDYRADRTLSAAVHEPASELVKAMYAKKLAEAPGPGEDPTVVFSAGGTGAGKTVGLRSAAKASEDIGRAQIVYDTNMNTLASASQKIDQALAAGKAVHIVYTWRDPVDALTAGALPRAERMGRTVPLEEHAKTHVGAADVIKQLAAKYANNDRVSITAVDNSRGRGEQRVMPVESVPRLDYNRVREDLAKALEAERSAGRISEAVYRGTADAQAKGPAPGRSDRQGPARSEAPGGVTPFDSGAAPPQPGQPFLVMRVGSSGELANRNAGNPQAIADFLARVDDPDRPQPTGAAKSNKLTVYRVVSQDALGKYELGAQGKDLNGDSIGRRSDKNGVVYSFPKGAKYSADSALTLSLDDLRADLKLRTGTDNFDDLGSIQGGRALEAIIQERLAKPESVATATGRKLEVRPRLVDIGQLVTSDKAAYPKELQPRQRGARKALDEQVQHIAKNLDPARLGDSAEADRGAPITGDGVVESGNGRVMALRYAYENLPEKAAEYRKFLESKGYDLTDMKQPMLVRDRVTPLSEAERRAFTVEANQAATAALSPVERAQADARLIDSAALSRMRGGDISSVQNSDFVRGFLEQLPQAERNSLVNPDGSVSQEGVRRIQAALLAKAYGGAPESNTTLGRLLESTDSDMRSALGALLDAAPAFARLRQAIADGKVSGEYDISGALTQAIENVAHLRLTGQSLHDFLAQQDMLAARPPIVDDLMRTMYDRTGTRIAGREKIAAALTKYAGQASRQRLDQASLFAETPVSAEKLVSKTVAEEQAPLPKVADMFGLRTPQGASPEAAAVASVRQLAAERPDAVVYSGFDQDGNPIKSTVAAESERIQREYARDIEDTKAYEAAVTCFMGHGG